MLRAGKRLMGITMALKMLRADKRLGIATPNIESYKTDLAKLGATPEQIARIEFYDLTTPWALPTESRLSVIDETFDAVEKSDTILSIERHHESMAQGGGKYDELATLVRKTAQAKLAAVLILDGNKGKGMALSIQSETPEHNANLMVMVPALLRKAADDLDDDLAEMAKGAAK
jgi:hypothetical protein